MDIKQGVNSVIPFIDYIKIRQYHPNIMDISVIDKTFNVSIADCDGVVVEEYSNAKSKKFEGSFSTSIHLRCFNGLVEISGNVGHLNRPDNLFNYDFKQTIKICNQILIKHGLPIFTDGNSGFTSEGDFYSDGAKITRIDLCSNIGFKDKEAKRTFMELVCAKKRSRTVHKVYEDNLNSEEGSYKGGRIKETLYDKEQELRQHKKWDLMSPKTKKFILKNNIARYEVKLFRKTLADLFGGYLKFLSQEKFNEIYQMKLQTVLDSAVINLDATDTLSDRELRAFTRYEKGLSPQGKKSTQYRLRKIILNKIGVDISIPNNVIDLSKYQKTKVITIEPQSLVQPDFYQLPEIKTLVSVS